MLPPPNDTFPGWRPDPEAAHAERFWDGRTWTDKTRPAPRPLLDERWSIETADDVTIFPDRVAESPETVLPETVLPETVLPETVLPETVLPETVLPETVLPETVLPERLSLSNLAPPGTSLLGSAGSGAARTQDVSVIPQADASLIDAPEVTRTPIRDPSRFVGGSDRPAGDPIPERPIEARQSSIFTPRSPQKPEDQRFEVARRVRLPESADRPIPRTPPRVSAKQVLLILFVLLVGAVLGFALGYQLAA